MFFQQPPPHPPTEPVICIHETLGRGPEWLCDDYVEARPVTVGLFINDESFRLLLFFFSHTLLLNFFYINETESKLVSPPTQRIWHFWSKIPDPVFVFHPHQSMLRPAELRCRLQDQLAHDDAHYEEEHDESHRAGAQPLLFLHANRGVLRWHHVALPHPQSVVLLRLGENGKCVKMIEKMMKEWKCVGRGGRVVVVKRNGQSVNQSIR